jgi:hypothetical protein
MGTFHIKDAKREIDRKMGGKKMSSFSSEVESKRWVVAIFRLPMPVAALGDENTRPQTPRKSSPGGGGCVLRESMVFYYCGLQCV